MFFGKKLIIYVFDSGFYYFDSKNVSFDNFVSFDNETVINDFFEKLPANINIKILLDTTEKEIVVEDVPNLNLLEKIKFKKILSLKNLDKRVDTLSIDYVKFNNQELARIYKLYKNNNIKLLLDKAKFFNILVLGIYSSTFYFEKFVNYNLSIKKAIGKVQQKIFVIRRNENSYRIFFIYDKSLLLTRVVDFPEDIMGDMERFGYIAREADMTIRYLSNVDLFNMSAEFKIYIIDEQVNDKFKVEKLLNESFNLKNELIEDHLLTSVFEILDTNYFCNASTTPEYMIWLACVLKSYASPAALPEPYSAQVYQAVVLRNILLIFSFIVFIIGSYYLGSLTSKYFFITEKMDLLSSKTAYLKRMKADLENVIDIPYDARDLQKIVDFSNQFPKVANNVKIVKPLNIIANVMDNNKDINLVNLSLKRIAQKNVFVGSEFVIKADFFINQPKILYSENLSRIYDFTKQLKSHFTNIKFVDMPIEVNPEKAQNVNNGMIMPDSIPFSLEFRWKYHE